jgi:hypothetical protein
MIELHGRGDSHPIWTQTTEATTATWLDTGADGGRIGSGQKLFGRRGTWEEKYIHFESRDHCKRVWALHFKAFITCLSCALSHRDTTQTLWHSLDCLLIHDQVVDLGEIRLQKLVPALLDFGVEVLFGPLSI